jgi:tetratricopeptide (TPR) repeat protein
MDLLDFDGEEMYFDQPLGEEAVDLLALAAQHYGQPAAEHRLMRAYFLEPEHLTVLVALYRYFYYRRQYADALIAADRAIAVASRHLDLNEDWRALSRQTLGRAVPTSMSMTRFLLLALKGAGYLQLRLGDPAGALERFEKVIEIDTSNRLGMKELVTMARARLTEEQAHQAGDKVSYLPF